ncbi:hypothetical protein Pla144_03560 [Bythopirellula polymerisocia]|uniref:Uncharacterized protein n=2 Tax=Bythopirellula polymerisocia TaxID=2528003 RepID=A0A5C6CYW5_9BACT|nr:hypothetical protein Pla144_03560 [Bythopirellula polymerisocia]
MSRVSKIGIGVWSSGLALVMAFDIVGANLGQANECQPPTPCPCAADGNCLPKRETWGTYKTHWRPWPGEQVGLTPTKAEETKSDIREQLPVYQPPRPDQEDLRGPAKRTKAPSATTSAPPEGGPQALPDAGEAEPAENEFELPGLPGLPGIDPQGYLPRENHKLLTEMDDAPPTLPLGLSESLAVTTSYEQQQVQPASGPTAVANRSKAAFIPNVDGPIVQASAELKQASEIQLSNPAGRHIYKPTDEELHQAIFIEASDGSPEVK